MAKLRAGLVLLLAAVTALVLAACIPDAPQTVCHRVIFEANGRVLTSLEVADGRPVPDFEPRPEGGIFVCWQLNGEDVEVSNLAVTGPMRLTARVVPQLQLHTPYLQLDGRNRLYPEGALTADALADAIRACTLPESQEWLPELPGGRQKLSGAQLRDTLQLVFAQDISGLVPDVPTATRAHLANALFFLLGGQADETFALGEGAVVPTDVAREREDLAALMEACVAHTPQPGGLCWQDLDLITTAEPGFLLLDGWLYYVQEDHRYLRNGTVGTLQFGPDGRQTSGIAELDVLVAETLRGFAEQAPEADALTLLRMAYDHSHTAYKYLRREIYSFGQTGWGAEDALEMMTTGRGNCYNFAAVFWALARGLGYDAQVISGTCTDTRQPHGWVLIEMDGVGYFFDPEWQYAYRERGERGHDMFKIPPGHFYYWTYRWKR